MVRVFAVIVVVVAFVSACAGGGAPFADGATQRHEPIINGAPDDVHTNVVALEIGNEFCSGTYVGRRSVVSAGHCVNESATDAVAFFGSDAVVSGDACVNDGDAAACRQFIPIIAQHRDPDYVSSPVSNDVAVFRLSADPPADIIAAQLIAADDGTGLSSADVGAQVTVVGFGFTDGVNHTGLGRRMSANLSIGFVGPDATAPVTRPGGNEPGINADEVFFDGRVSNTCGGDSGGPMFVVRNGVEMLAAVTSFGDAECIDHGVSNRVDSHLDFILNAIGPPAPAGWSCDPLFFGDGAVCDCGCGIVDVDCPTVVLAQCQASGCPDNEVPSAADPSQCNVSACGDGVTTVSEACDDGDTLEAGGCSADCSAVTAGFACVPPFGACHPIACGDGFVDAPEACDDGNLVDGDGCSASCEVEACAGACVANLYTACSCGADDPCAWSGDGVCDQVTCATFTETPFVDPDCVSGEGEGEGEGEGSAALCDGACDALQYTACTCASNDPCAWAGDGFCDETTCATITSTPFHDPDCTAGEGEGEGEAALCDGACTGLQYTACTCAPNDPCHWAGDGFCDEATCATITSTPFHDPDCNAGEGEGEGAREGEGEGEGEGSPTDRGAGEGEGEKAPSCAATGETSSELSAFSIVLLGAARRCRFMRTNRG